MDLQKCILHLSSCVFCACVEVGTVAGDMGMSMGMGMGMGMDMRMETEATSTDSYHDDDDDYDDLAKTSRPDV